MKKLLIFCYLIPVFAATSLFALQENDWWIIKYYYKLRPSPSAHMQKDSIYLMSEPSFILKFVVEEIDSNSYVVDVETPEEYMRKERNINPNLYARYKLFIERKNFMLAEIRQFSSKKYTPLGMIYKEHGLNSIINGRFAKLIMHTHGELFTIPFVSDTSESIFVCGDEGSHDYDVSDWCKSVIQRAETQQFNFKNKRISYRIIDLTQGRFSIRQVWIKELPWWMFHEGRKFRAELINSSFYSKEDIETLKKLIKNDLEKKKKK